MNDIIKLVEFCNNEGIVFNLENEELSIEAEKGTLNQELLKQIKNNKLKLISFFKKKFCDLSFSQERLWFNDQLNHNASYNIPGAIELNGPVDINILEKTIQKIITRHEILRTNFILIKNEPKQVIHENANFSLYIIDLSNTQYQNVRKKVFLSIEKESKYIFNLESDNLFRVVLYKLSEQQFILYFNMHHIISDGWSFAVLTHEISIFYESLINNKPNPLPNLPIQYSDYAKWQKEEAKGEAIKAQTKFWEEKLANTSILEFPTDKIRPKHTSFNGKTISFIIDNEITQQLNELSNSMNASLFMTLLSAFNVLLYKYSGEQDICVGTPIANRTREELEKLIGFFVNTITIRSNIDPVRSFNELIYQVKETTLQAYENQDTPFEKVVEAVDPKRNTSQSPLFQVMLVLQNNPVIDLKFSGISVSILELKSSVSKFDITLHIKESNVGLDCAFEYNTDIFESATIKRLITHFNILLASITKNPDVPLKDLSILNNCEIEQLLFTWNKTSMDFNFSKTIDQLFIEQAERTPNKTALEFNDKSITYLELNLNSNIIANYLLNKFDNGENKIIGVILKRSEKLLYAILGIIKAGFAYLPIDPEYPKQRINTILEDAKPVAIINETSENQYININDILGNKNSSFPNRKHNSESTLYIIYTSGSTGKPKGTIIQHYNFINYISWASNYYLKDNITGNFSLFTSISFDLTATCIFLPLLNGKTLEIFDQNQPIENILLNTFKSNSIDCVKLTPSHISLLGNLNIETSKIKLIIAGGEELLNDHIHILKKLNRNITVINEYGPTEVTVGCIAHNIQTTEEPIMIGRPIANTHVYIARDLELLPPGIPGEILVGGKSVTKGYLHRPNLTNKKFISNPFTKNKNDLLYKTGDLAKYLPDGTIQYLGRIDNQVKLRGYRIELGEIEAAINKYENISTSVVSLIHTKSNNKILIGYFVKESLDCNVNSQELIKHLRSELPDFMVPTTIIELKEIPLTINGKVNKKALPKPDGKIDTNTEYKAPETNTEKRLVEIWEQILGVDKIGIHDNFFELGGHSLLATSVHSHIKAEFSAELPLKVFFEEATISYLAQQIDSGNYIKEMADIKKAKANEEEFQLNAMSDYEEIEF